MPGHFRFDSGARDQSPIWCRWSARLPEEQEVPDRYRGSAPFRGGRPKGGPQPSKLVMRVRLPPSVPICSSVVQGQDGGLLIRESRFESSRWSQTRVKCYGSTAGSNPARWGSIPHARANSCREPGGLGAELQPPRTRFDSAAALQSHGDHRSTAGREIVALSIAVRFRLVTPNTPA